MERKRLYHLKREDSNTSDSTSDFFARSEERKPVRKLVTPNSSLEIIDGDEFGASGAVYDRSPSETSFRSWSRASVGSIPPRNDSSLSRRTLTPTKQVCLQAVRRREESSEPFVDHIDVESARFDGGGIRKAWEFSNHDDDIDFSRLSVGDHRKNHRNKYFDEGTNLHSSPSQNGEVEHIQTVNTEDNNKKSAATKDKDNSSSEDDDDGGDDEDDEDEKRKAPNELLMEFVDCLMKKDYPNSSKLCKMILLYEPENEEALKFQPLIEEKMKLDAEAAAAAEEGGSDDDEDDDDDDDDDDDSDDDSSSDDDDDSSEDDDDNEDAGGRKETQGTIAQSSGDNRIVGANTSTRVWKPAS